MGDFLKSEALPPENLSRFRAGARCDFNFKKGWGFSTASLGAIHTLEVTLPYPFNENPFEEYFLELRKHSKLKHDVYSSYFIAKELGEKTDSFSKKLVEISESIKHLKIKYSIPDRDHDVFLGEVDLAIAEYEQEFPRPEKPSPCKHKTNQICLRQYADGSHHVVTQCLTCGSPIKDHKKSSISNWQSLPSFDNSIQRADVVAYHQWWDSLWKIKEEAVGEDGKYPEFDDNQFRVDYEKNNPKPMSPHECPHYEKALTLRTYRNGSVAVVEQCFSCGKHIRSVSKKEANNLRKLPSFNENIEESLYKRISDWHKKQYQSWQSAKIDFHNDLGHKIKSGYVTRVDKSTFGSYYDSEEWKITRSRILERDDNTCQACGENAECVHHLLYERLGRENDLDLISLCSSCHFEIHQYQDQNGSGYKLTPIEIKTLKFKQRANRA